MKYRLVRSILRTKAEHLIRYSGERLIGISDYMNHLNLLTKQEVEILSRNELFRNLHKGQRAFVIANGPSLKDQDLNLLKNEIKFAVAGFYKHPIISENWQPTYYSVIDKQFFEDPVVYEPFWSGLKEKIKDTTFFISLSRGYGFNKVTNILPSDRTFYCAHYGTPIKDDLDFTKLTMGFQTVASMSIALAVYMGCNPIYLLGYDHDYLAHRGKDHHFYEGNILGGRIKDKFENSNIETIYPYYFTMQFMQKFWNNYKKIKQVADQRNIRIINATRGGFLDVFERTDYETIF
jgi:hypothetical protein